MCFSATASFGAAAALGGIGVIAVRRAPTRAHLAFAAIPLVFALQQVSEGFVWRALEAAPFHVGRSRWETAFLAFALFVWPVYMPIALRPIEPSARRRRALAALSFVGAMLGAYLMACASLRPSNACIALGNLYYWVQIDAPLKLPALVAYVAIVVAPLFLSSVRGTSVLGVAVLAACAAAAALDRAGFVSVWCFFAAILSLVAATVATRRVQPRVVVRGQRRPRRGGSAIRARSRTAAMRETPSARSSAPCERRNVAIAAARTSAVHAAQTIRTPSGLRATSGAKKSRWNSR